MSDDDEQWDELGDAPAPDAGDAELDELTGAWALDAVDDDERAAFERRLADDADVRSEADDLREIAGLLGEAAAERPPTDLRAAILAEVAETPQERPGAEPVGAADTDGVVVPMRRRTRPRLVAGLAAAAVVAIALVGVAVVGRDGDDEAGEIAAVLDDPGAIVRELVGEVGTVRLVLSDTEGAAVVRADDLPVPTGDRTYQLWTVTADGDISPSELFRPDDDGRVEVRLDGVVDGTGFAISEEPEGGSPQPTGEIVAIHAVPDF